MSTDNVVRHVLDNGTIHYRNAAGAYHRIDGPAIVLPDGTEEWWLNDERHREDGPAVVYPDGTKEWYLNGVFHREDGPAAVYPDGTEEWCQNGKRHRKDGPAVVYPDGTKQWRLNDKLHREDGPSVVKATGNCEYWIDGVFLVGVIPVSGQVYFNRLHDVRFSTELVVKVMSDKGFASVEEFGSWLAFEVLSEEAVPVITRVRKEGTTVLPVLDEYLRNHETYEGLPFSWWYPIVEGKAAQEIV